MNTEALLRLADKLEGKGAYVDVGPIPEVQFDLNLWVKQRHECGTVACACGYAILDPWFNARGLVAGEGNWGNKFTPEYGSWDGYDAVEQFFGINYSQARHLFDDESYERGTPHGVATRIRAFVEKNALADYEKLVHCW